MRAFRLLLSAMLVVVACDDTPGDDTDDGAPTDSPTGSTTDVPAAGDAVVVVDGVFDLALGSLTTLAARTVNGTDSAYDWSSDDEVVATVDAEGVVFARSAGVATITAQGVDTAARGSLGVVVSVTTPYEADWARGAHATVDAEAFRHWDGDPEVPHPCARCHSTSGFQDYTGADGTAFESLDVMHPPGGVLACTACHNATADHLDSVTFPSGVTVTDLGGEARCLTCHQGRSSTDAVDDQIDAAGVGDDVISQDLSFTNIHYYAAGATLLAGKVRGGYQYEDHVYDARFRHAPGVENCQDCHDPHSLEVQFDLCETCHPGVTDLASVRNIRMLPSFGQDYDGNGNTVEGMYFEVRGLKDDLLTAIGRYPTTSTGAAICYDAHAYPYWFVDTDASGTACDPAEASSGNAYDDWTPRLARAAYNYQAMTKDPGAWAHNANYAIKLLYDSIEDLNEVLGTPVDLSQAVRNDPGHFNGASRAARNWDTYETVTSSCSKCHGGSEGYRFYVQYGATKTVDAPDNGLDCYTCHEEFQTFSLIEVDEVLFPSGAELELSGDHANLCGTCHSGRSSGELVKADIAAEDWGFSNIHYLPAAATMYASEAAAGFEYEDAPGPYAGAWTTHPGGSACVDCHNVVVDDHSHSVRTNFSTCTNNCHLNALEPDDIRGPGRSPDYDGDGDTDEALADEIATLRDQLYDEILRYAADALSSPICRGTGYPYWFTDTDGNGLCEGAETERTNSYGAWDGKLMAATFNHQFATVEPGAWAHNFNYMGQLLYDSIRDLGGDTGDLQRP